MAEFENNEGISTGGRTLMDVVRDSVSGVIRDEQGYDVTPSEKALVRRWLSRITTAEKHHKTAFKRMRDDMDFAYKYGIGKQWPGQGSDDDRYIANFVQRHITARVSALYSKNPKAVFRRRQRLDFAIWEGDPESIEQALQTVQMAAQAGMPAPQQAIELLLDVQQGVASRRTADRVGKTLEILFNYAVNEQQPNFKAQMKQLVRRVEVCGVAYVRVGYQRLMEKKADSQARLADAMTQLKNLERLRDDLLDEKFDEDSPEMEEIRATVEALNQEEIVLREGMTFDFPRSTSIIMDTNTTQIVGWVGTDWIAEKWHLSPSEIQSIWRVDIGSGYTRYEYSGSDSTPRKLAEYEMGSDKKEPLACVYKVYDRKTGTSFVVVEGYCGFIERPAAPDVRVESFFPVYGLAFNQVEHEEEIFPPSDVRLIMHQQREHNRTREAVRQHRIANRPLYVTPNGSFEEEDDANLANYPAHAVVALDGLKEGGDIGNLLQPVKKVPIDPNVYETQQIFNDVLRVVGTQEANMGGTSNASATESSIAETSRLSSLSSNVDDLDELLTEIARASGQIMLRNMPKEMVMEIVGPGAMWPELTNEQMVKEVWLECQAGSSGKPNKAQEMANFERVAPFIVQIPGIRPTQLARHVIGIMDDRTDIEEWVTAGLPSIQALNGLMQQPAMPGAAPPGAGQPSTGNPQTDPAQQGPQGASNVPAGAETRGGPQPGYPAPVQ